VDVHTSSSTGEERLRHSKLGSGYELVSWRHSASVVVRAFYPISMDDDHHHHDDVTVRHAAKERPGATESAIVWTRDCDGQT
jgi:hypothetical protein